MQISGGQRLAGPGLAAGILVPSAALGSLAFWVWPNVERPELIQAEHGFGLVFLGNDLAVGDRAQVFDAQGATWRDPRMWLPVVAAICCKSASYCYIYMKANTEEGGNAT